MGSGSPGLSMFPLNALLGLTSPHKVMTPNEAESMARWVVCAEFHDDCRCVDGGRGLESATYEWDDDDEEFKEVRAAYGFAIVIRSTTFDGEQWSVTLDQLPTDSTSPECEYIVEGVKGPSFFTSVTRRMPGS